MYPLTISSRICPIALGLILMLGLSLQRADAQISEATLMTSRADFSRIDLNPAYTPEDARLVIGLPLGETGLSLSSPFSLASALSRPGAPGSPYHLHYDRLLQGMKDKPFGASYQLGLLHLGLHTRIGFFSMGLSLRGEVFSEVDGSFADLLLEGNGGHLGQWRHFELGRSRGFALGQLALGYSTDMLLESRRLSLGARLKVLMGLTYAELAKSRVSLYTSPTGDELKVEAHQILYVHTGRALPQKDGRIDWDRPIPVGLAPFGNYGLGLDLGAIYTIDDRWRVGLSVRDLGFVRWGESHTLEEDLRGDKAIVYRGVDVSEVLVQKPYGADRGINSALEMISRSLQDNFSEGRVRSLVSGLEAKIHATAEYKPLGWLTLGTMFGTSRMLGRWRPDISLSAGLRPSRGFATHVSLGSMNGSPINLGLGFVLGRKFQVYAAFDNIFAFNPLYLHFFHARAGISLRF